MRLYALSAMLAFAISALPIAAGQTADGRRTDPGITDGSKQRRLDRARRDFRSTGVRSYRYVLSVSCYCPPLSDTIVVRNGRPTAGTDPDLADEATVPRLFRKIQRAIDAKVTRITVRYGTRGVPRSIYIDSDQRIADDETGYTIARFTPLKP